MRSASGADRSNFEKWGAAAAFGMCGCYVVMFVVFGVALNIPQTEVIDEKVAYLSSHQAILSLGYFFGYLVFGTLLLTLVQATHHRVKTGESHLLNSASLFGLIWVTLMMCSGMLALIGVDTMARLHFDGSENATTVFYIYAVVVDALGGGIELVGGMWMLLLSIAALSTQKLSRALSSLGIIGGCIGLLTVYQDMPALKDAFGLSQIVWFLWLGGELLRTSHTSGFRNAIHDSQAPL